MPECFRGCGTPIKFDDNVRSSSGKRIPLEMDGTPHQCPNSNWGKDKDKDDSGSFGKGFNAAEAIAGIDKKLDQILAKHRELEQTILKLILAVTTVQMRIEGQTGMMVDKDGNLVQTKTNSEKGKAAQETVTESENNGV